MADQLAETRAVAIAPAELGDAAPDGLRFVRAFKGGTPLIGASAALMSRQARYARTPFLVQPLAGDTRFAIFYTASRWCFCQTTALPLADAVSWSIRG